MDKKFSHFLEELTWRGIAFQKTPGIEEVLKKKTTLYIGIDPTGDSLHVGHLFGLLTLKRAVDAGHSAIVIMGGGTALIGDPSGKEKERPVLSRDAVEENKKKLKKQIDALLKNSATKIISARSAPHPTLSVVDNAQWLEKVQLIEFLRDAGKFVTVNAMLDLETVKTRMDKKEGMSYAEFTYQLLQAYDFLKLHEEYECQAQIGGSDQWGNMVQGIELIRKKTGKNTYALSIPLIVNPKTGKKFGKTESGTAMWLDPEKTHPFAFYQFLLNSDDEMAPTLLKYFSFKERGEIEKIENEWNVARELRGIQKALAYELTKMIHGEKIAQESQAVSALLFEQNFKSLKNQDIDFIKDSIPYIKTSKENFALEQALVDTELCSSKNEAKRLVEQKGVSAELLLEKYYLIKKGKREFGIVEIT